MVRKHCGNESYKPLYRYNETFQRKSYFSKNDNKLLSDWSSKKEHKVNALALGADERRGKLR